MKVKAIPVGYLRCNCYLVEKNDKLLVIDPGDELNKIVENIEESEVVGILITHNHFDHVGCVDELADMYQVKVYNKNNLDEGKHQIDDFLFEVIYTFGHTEDSITYYFNEENIMFTGDFLFLGTIGRCDLDGGDFGKMIKSIEKIKKFPDDILIYPGHGDNTVLGREKKFNPYFEKKDFN